MPRPLETISLLEEDDDLEKKPRAVESFASSKQPAAAAIKQEKPTHASKRTRNIISLLDDDSDDDDVETVAFAAKKTKAAGKLSPREPDISKNMKLGVVGNHHHTTFTNDLENSSEDDSEPSSVIVRAGPKRKRNYHPEKRLKAAQAKTRRIWDEKGDCDDEALLVDEDACGSTGVKALPLPAKGPEQDAILDQIGRDNQADCLLQMLLWYIGCRYTLLPHQFAGVRSIASVTPDYPDAMVQEWMSAHIDEGAGHSCLSQYFDIKWEIVLQRTLFIERRGVLMADVMGLGKVRMHAPCLACFQSRSR